MNHPHFDREARRLRDFCAQLAATESLRELAGEGRELTLRQVVYENTLTALMTYDRMIADRAGRSAQS